MNQMMIILNRKIVNFTAINITWPEKNLLTLIRLSKLLK